MKLAKSIPIPPTPPVIPDKLARKTESCFDKTNRAVIWVCRGHQQWQEVNRIELESDDKDADDLAAMVKHCADYHSSRLGEAATYRVQYFPSRVLVQFRACADGEDDTEPPHPVGTELADSTARESVELMREAAGVAMTQASETMKLAIEVLKENNGSVAPLMGVISDMGKAYRDALNIKSDSIAAIERAKYSNRQEELDALEKIEVLKMFAPAAKDALKMITGQKVAPDKQAAPQQATPQQAAPQQAAPQQAAPQQAAPQQAAPQQAAPQAEPAADMPLNHRCELFFRRISSPVWGKMRKLSFSVDQWDCIDTLTNPTTEATAYACFGKLYDGLTADPALGFQLKSMLSDKQWGSLQFAKAAWDKLATAKQDSDQ